MDLGVGISVSLSWLGTMPSLYMDLPLIHLFIFPVNDGCLLSGGEKDVKLIPSLIKTVSRLNMYEHILIWGLNRKEN